MHKLPVSARKTVYGEERPTLPLRSLWLHARQSCKRSFYAQATHLCMQETCVLCSRRFTAT